jgi:hypothetical protein
MAPGSLPGLLHPQRTQRSAFQYFFYDKHHGKDPLASQWLAEIKQDEEFAVFDLADLHGLSDDKGNLFGLRLGPASAILELGTDSQQVAEFPASQPQQAWHGYPMWPLKSRGRPRLASPKQGLLKMVAAQLLTRPQYQRLIKGKPA